MDSNQTGPGETEVRGDREAQKGSFPPNPRRGNSIEPKAKPELGRQGRDGGERRRKNWQRELLAQPPRSRRDRRGLEVQVWAATPGSTLRGDSRKAPTTTIDPAASGGAGCQESQQCN